MPKKKTIVFEDGVEIDIDATLVAWHKKHVTRLGLLLKEMHQNDLSEEALHVLYALDQCIDGVYEDLQMKPTQIQ
jgi:hypothetical protein